MTPRRLAVISNHFSYSYPVMMLGHIKNNLKPMQDLAQYAAPTPDASERRFLSVLAQRGPIATIGISIRPNEVVTAAYKKANTPIVLIDEEADGASTVAIDNYRGGLIAGQHLVKIGRKNIAIVCGLIQLKAKGYSYNANARLNGFRDALAAGGIPLPATHVTEVEFYSYQEGRQALAAWLDQKLKIDAVFCAAGDDCATGLLRSAQERGVRVPEDIAVIGFDDLEIAKSTTPPLTTIKQPLEKMATAAYELASDSDNDIAQHPKKIILDPELVVREST